MANKGKYIYCVIKEKNPLKYDVHGIRSGLAYTIHQGDWAAVVSDSPVEDYLITREHTMAHQMVLEEVMRRCYDILPVSFGTVADNEKMVKEKLLKPKKDEFCKAFEKIEGKIELNFKVLWSNISSVFNEIAEENLAIKRAKHAAQSKPLGRFQAARIGEMIKNELDRKRAKISEKILSKLRPLAQDARTGEILQDAMICNETFLVPKISWKVYDTRIFELAKTYGDRMNFMNMGPLPPYNFVSINVSFRD